jgi:hypothetical protein
VRTFYTSGPFQAVATICIVMVHPLNNYNYI